MSYAYLNVDNRVKFSTYAPSVLGSRHTDMKVMGKINFSLAARMRDVSPLHKAILSSLPSGTPADPKDLTYISFLNLVTNEEVVFATAWINESSIELLNNGRIGIEIDPTSLGDMDRLRSMLSEAGFRFTIKAL